MKEAEWNIIQKIVAAMIIQRESALRGMDVIGDRAEEDVKFLEGRIEALKQELFKL